MSMILNNLDDVRTLLDLMRTHDVSEATVDGHKFVLSPWAAAAHAVPKSDDDLLFSSADDEEGDL